MLQEYSYTFFDWSEIFGRKVVCRKIKIKKRHCKKIIDWPTAAADRKRNSYCVVTTDDSGKRQKYDAHRWIFRPVIRSFYYAATIIRRVYRNRIYGLYFLWFGFEAAAAGRGQSERLRYAIAVKYYSECAIRAYVGIRRCNVRYK